MYHTKRSTARAGNIQPISWVNGLHKLPYRLHITARRGILRTMQCQCRYKHIVWAVYFLCGCHRVYRYHMLGNQWL